jgi:hypothetical protein
LVHGLCCKSCVDQGRREHDQPVLAYLVGPPAGAKDSTRLVLRCASCRRIVLAMTAVDLFLLLDRQMLSTEVGEG